MFEVSWFSPCFALLCFFPFLPRFLKTATSQNKLFGTNPTKGVLYSLVWVLEMCDFWTRKEVWNLLGNIMFGSPWPPLHREMPLVKMGTKNVKAKLRAFEK